MRWFDPYLWVFAGPNGAGKSTLAAQHLRGRLPIVNPDVIALSLPKLADGTDAVIEAGKIALRERASYLGRGESFAVETTMSGKSELRLMRDAIRAGYKVNLVFVGVDIPDTSVARVAHRVRMGLHFVPAEDIVRRYGRSMENLPIAMQLSTRSLLVDNTGRRFRLLLIREHGRIRRISRELPAWVLAALPEELR
jgi:predicted ABC-type ATPase